MSGPARPPIEPIERSVPLRFCSDEQLELLRAATLRVLEEIGVRFDSALARDILHGHGARVDAETKVVRLPADLVEKAMARAPRSFVLGARDPSCELDLAREATFFTTDGCGTEVIDWVTGERRSSTKADLAAVTRLQDYLPGISFWWPTVAAGDCGRTAQLHEIHAGWSNTVKHIQGFVQGGRAAELRRADGDGRGRRAGAAAPPARHVGSDRHRVAARSRRGRHGGGAGVRRRRRPGVASSPCPRTAAPRRPPGPAPWRWAAPSSSAARCCCSSPTRARRCCTRSCRASSTRATAASSGTRSTAAAGPWPPSWRTRGACRRSRPPAAPTRALPAPGRAGRRTASTWRLPPWRARSSCRPSVSWPRTSSSPPRS